MRLTIFIALLLCVNLSGQTTLHVEAGAIGPGTGSPGDPFASIQAAIVAAVSGDRILVGPGDYFEQDVDFLGKAIVVQSTDGAETGAWNKDSQSWEELSAGDYATAVRKGVRIAKKQATIELLNMPVSAPEAN